MGDQPLTLGSSLLKGAVQKDPSYNAPLKDATVKVQISSEEYCALVREAISQKLGLSGNWWNLIDLKEESENVEITLRRSEMF